MTPNANESQNTRIIYNLIKDFFFHHNKPTDIFRNSYVMRLTKPLAGNTKHTWKSLAANSNWQVTYKKSSPQTEINKTPKLWQNPNFRINKYVKQTTQIKHKSTKSKE